MKSNTLIHLVAAASLFAASSAAQAEPQAGTSNQLQCRATLGANEVIWNLELDDSIPLAVVNDFETPAEYAPSHATVRLSHGGPSLIIGRSTGRLMVADAGGKTIAVGGCMPTVLMHVSQQLADQCPMQAQTGRTQANPVRSNVTSL